jgi:hypothetical protein
MTHTDTERLDWLERNAGDCELLDGVGDGFRIAFWPDLNPNNEKRYNGTTLREALDRAIDGLHSNP